MRSSVRRAGGLVLAAMMSVAAWQALAQVSARDCPQPRFTGKAPDEYYNRKNPFSGTGNPDPRRAQAIFEGTSGSENCAICHGRKGDGRGELSRLYDPPPRNFACAQTVNGVPDGQLFWIIRFGSPGTSMPPHPGLSDDQIWQIVLHLRTLAK
ncbi:MAG: cytochrome c [Betaproteobacteria bacterium]|nr:cytochrome c [Betaproteobacteria bacterium]